MKLREFLQQQWISRRTIISYINNNQLFLNWVIVQSYWLEIKQGDCIHTVDKKWIYENMSISEKKQFLCFYKPVGCVCSKLDKYNTTIYNYLPEIYHNRYYIGRLDKDSRWLVLLTNDPKIVNEYEHPRHWITKEYLVTLNKSFSKEDVKRCLEGIENEGNILKAVECQIFDDVLYDKNKKYLLSNCVKKPSCVIKIVLNEWKKRHIRRMMSSMRYHVEDLVRIREEKFELWDLKEGSFALYDL